MARRVDIYWKAVVASSSTAAKTRITMLLIFACFDEFIKDSLAKISPDRYKSIYLYFFYFRILNVQKIIKLQPIFYFLINVTTTCNPVLCLFYQRHCAWQLFLRQGGLRFSRTSGTIRDCNAIYPWRFDSLLLQVPCRNGIYISVSVFR